MEIYKLINPQPKRYNLGKIYWIFQDKKISNQELYKFGPKNVNLIRKKNNQYYWAIKLKDKNVKKCLELLYSKKQKSTYYIAKLLHTTPATVRKYLLRYNISLRSCGESTKLSYQNKDIVSCNLGKKLSDTTKKKISKNHKDVSGKNNPMYGKKGILSPAFGKKHSEKRRKMSSLRLKGKRRPEISGKNNPNWKGKTDLIINIRNSSLMKDWRENIFSRDEYKCQNCLRTNDKKTNLEAHHIIFLSFLIQKYSILTTEQAYSEKNLWDIKNGITFCKSCHKNIHKFIRYNKIKPCLVEK